MSMYIQQAENERKLKDTIEAKDNLIKLLQEEVLKCRQLNNHYEEQVIRLNDKIVDVRKELDL